MTLVLKMNGIVININQAIQLSSFIVKEKQKEPEMETLLTPLKTFIEQSRMNQLNEKQEQILIKVIEKSDKNHSPGLHEQ